MPPEPLPWERKDYFKDHRKHDAVGGSRGGGASSSSSLPRWRDAYHGPRDFPRASPRRPPPGHYRQGGFYHPVYPEDSGGHGCTPSRSDRFLAESDGFRSSSSGRYGGGRSGGGRDSRGSHQRSPLWDSGDFLRQHHESHVTGLRSVAVPVSSASQPPLKDLNDKIGGVANDGLATGHRFYHRDRSSWKPSLKWSRHGSSSSTKGDKSDTGDARLEVAVPSGKETPVRSPVMSPLPSEGDGPLKKKPRLGWGQGLAKYEKQKVGGPSHVSESDVARDLNDTIVKVSGPPVPVSPATPCSATCSSSLNEKPETQSLNGDGDKCSIIPAGLPDDIPVKLDHLGTNPVTALASLLSDLLQSEDVFSADLTFTKCSSLNKLLMLKEDISKELEKTECEIDLSENELKALACDIGNHLSTVTESTISSSGSREEHCNESNDSKKLDHVNIKSNTDIESMEVSHHYGNSNKESDVQFQTTNMVTVEPQALSHRVIQSTSLVKDISEAVFKNMDESSTSLQAESSRVIGAWISLTDGKERQLIAHKNEEATCSEGHYNNMNETTGTSTSTHVDSDMIVSTTGVNKDVFTGASLTPINTLQTDTPSDIWESVDVLSCRENDLHIKERLVFHKRLVNFKEQVLTFKFRALHHLWKEDLRLLSLRKHRPKSNKRFELGGRSLQSGSQKQRSSIKTSFVLPSDMSLIPTTEIVNFATTLLSASHMKLYRSNLKMPALILDEKEKFHMRFVTHNALVEDPLSVEREKSMINPWSQEEKEVIMEMLVKYGKDFTKISSYLQHKTTADCIEFYYKNHKSEMFKEVKERLDLRKQQQRLPASNYLVTSGKKWNPEANAAFVDLSGSSTVVASQNHISAKSKQNCAGKSVYGDYHDWKVSLGSHNGLDLKNSIEELDHERETLGTCVALSSEAMSSCVTNSTDLAGKLNLNVVDTGNKAEPSQHFDEDTCSDEGFMELHSNDWSDEEKSIFIRALSAYGKDFSRISSFLKSRSKEQCKIFYSKARKCLSLDRIHHDSVCNAPLNDKHGGRSDIDDACGTEIDSALCSIQSCTKLDEKVSHAFINTSSEVFTHDENILPCLEADGTSKQDSVADVKLDFGNQVFTHDENILPCLEADGTSKQDSVADVKLDSGNQIDCEQVIIHHHDESVDGQNCSQYSISSKGKAENVLPCNGTKAEYDDAVFVDQEVKMESNIDVKTLEAESTRGIYIAKTKDICLNAPVINVKTEVDLKPSCVAQNENKQRANIVSTETNGCLHGLKDDSNMNNDNRSSQSAFVPSYQHQTQPDLLHSLPKKAKSLSVKQETANSMPFNSFLPDQSSICFGNKLNVSPQSSLNFEEHNGIRHHNVVSRDPYQQYIDRTQTANQMSRQLHIHRSSPFKMLNHEIKREADQISKKPVLLETYSRRHGGSRSNMSFLSDMDGHHGDISSILSSKSGKQYPSKRDSSQSENQLKPCVKNSSSDSEEHKPGDVKLFGTILSQTSTTQKSNSSPPECSNKPLSSVPNGSSFISCSSAGGGAFGPGNGRSKGLEDHPFRTFGFWDSNRLQTGFTSVPEAAVFFSRYQGALQGSYFSAKDAIHNNNRDLRDYQESCMQHLTSDGNRVESFSNIQKNGMASGFWQQQGKVTRRTDGVGGGLVVGSGEVSDPVAALKLHYAAAQAKVLSSDIDSWRTDIGGR